MSLAFVSSSRLADHAPVDAQHPERPERLAAVHAAVRQAGMLTSASPFPDFQHDFELAADGPVMREVIVAEPVGDPVLRLAHPEHHIMRLRELAGAGGGLADAGDTYIGPESEMIARLAVAACVRATDEVAEGRARRAFAAVRPPGHHAEPNRAMGFCLYANAALAAMHLQRTHRLQRVAIVDFDVHHGNGTQAIFEDDPTVLNISLHQHPDTLWPGTGYAEEVGFGPGRGTTLNVPIRPNTTDEQYLSIFDAKIVPAVEKFRPEVLIVCAGFDAHAADPLANLKLTEAGYSCLGQRLATLADTLCDGRLVATLEGGYNPHALGRSVVAFLRAL